MFLSSPFPFGLDISDFSIKAVSLKERHLAKNKELVLSAFGQIAVPEGYFNKGEIKEFEKIAGLIKKLLKNLAKGKIATPYVISVLPESKTFIKLIETPFIEDENILETIKSEIGRDIPVSLEESYLDWQIISKDSKKNTFKILIAVAPKKMVDDYTLLLKKAGLKPLAFEIESVAIARCLINSKKIDCEQPLAIIDLGASRGSIIVFDEETIQLTSTISVSGQEISAALSSKLKISMPEAEKIKIVCGLNAEKCKKTIDEILEPAIEKLVKKTQEIINFYQNQTNKKINKILLCGGASNLKGLELFLSKKLKIETKKGNLLANLCLENPPISPDDFLSYATAIGLSLRAPLKKNNIL
ncbi:MAG: type IV pilus assembly protein PilM [Parcubacteria group bacterium Athens1014_10]|nr:MAG: type IV pilus assembly protein PilM [Parcubacteria group bacterium Athens1014_10]TSD04750.1 MAG: type IV pilus assembly protein PilM [Parcubacteria group bacterium Athens0714_12]